LKSKSPNRQRYNNNKIDYYDKNVMDTYKNYAGKNIKKKGKNNKNNNRNSRKTYQTEEKEFENKTFFSTELNMLGKKKSSPLK